MRDSAFPDYGDAYSLNLAKGLIGGHSVIHKYGRNPGLGTSFAPVSLGGVYQTPTSAVSLEFVSNAAADALNGAGMHELTVEGLDANWDLQTEVMAAHATDGTTAVAVTGTWLRVFRAYVSLSGTYASASAGSHSGDITIRVASAGATWATIDDTDFPLGQTEIGAYTVPLGKTAYLSSLHLDVNTSQTVDALFFQRPLANDVSSSYSAMRVVLQFDGISGPDDLHPEVPFGPFVGPCDLVFMAKGASNNDIDVDFELILVDAA
jgi:hypothetical protein